MTAAADQAGQRPPRRFGLGRAIGAALLLLLAALVVGWLSLRRADMPWATLDARYATPATRWLDLPDGLRVAYRDEGRRDGPPLVLVHGFSASLIDWDAWASRLGDEYRVIRLDLPGHGLTRAPPGYFPGAHGYADVVEAVTERLGVSHFVLAGNSMGGAVALDFAIRHPEHLSALVLVDAAGWPQRTQNKGGPLIFKILANPVGRFLIKDLDVRALTERGLKDAFLDPALVTPAVVERYVELARAPGHRDILIGRGARPPGPTVEQIAAIRVPTLVMHGRNDRLIPFSAGEGFARTIPGAQLAAYDGVGHVPMEQIPDRSATDLRTFLHAQRLGGGPQPSR